MVSSMLGAVMADSLFIEDIDFLVTLDEQRRVLSNAWVWVEKGLIREVGAGKPPLDLPAQIERLSGRGKIVIPGLVNTHHHFYQNMARAYSPGNNLPLLPWLSAMNKLWKNYQSDDLSVATRLGLVELMLSGATTIADHHYVFPRGTDSLIDRQFAVAREMGVRFHASRGSMDVTSDLIADWAVQSIDEILADTERLVKEYHDASIGSYQQVIVSPCAATSCTKDLLVESAELAKKYQLGLHTHCGETEAENAFSLQKFGMRPLEYLLDCGWNYDRTWLAHGIHFTDTELTILQQEGIGVAHCPNANMRLGSGICRVPEIISQGGKVGIGVDGSASNDSGHILGELRQALYLARVRYGAEAMDVMTALELGTWRAAEMMGRTDLGRIATGYCGDFAIFNTYDLFSSGCENPVDALLLCYARQVDALVIGGEIRVRDGMVLGLDLPSLMRDHQARATRLHQFFS